jgi:Trypsin-like peptidase domain
MRKRLIILIIVTLVMVCSPMAAEEWIGDTDTMEVKTPHPYPRGEKGDLVWTHTIHKVGSAWLKPHFSDLRINDEDYIELLDMEGTVVLKITGSDLEDGTDLFKTTKVGNKVSFWGPAIDGNEVTINLYRGSEKKKGWGFKVDEVGVGTAPILDEGISKIESICGTDDKTSIVCASTAYQTLGESVGRMLYQVRRKWYVCTGFLCSCNSSHFLTNEHCISSQTEVDTLQVRFYYRLNSCGGSSASYSTYYGDDFITDNSTYDFCLLTLLNSPQNTWGYLELINGSPVLNEDIYIIQHPGGREQEIGYGTVYSTTANSGKDLSYYVDTEGGSSGSPVFAAYENAVIGLHHYGGCPNSAVKMDYIYEYISSYLGCN